MQKVFLTIITCLSLIGCNQLPKFPSISKYMIDTKSGLCAQFKLIDPENQIYKYIKSVPLADCNGFFAMSPDDERAVDNWVHDVKLKYEQLKQCTPNGN